MLVGDVPPHESLESASLFSDLRLLETRVNLHHLDGLRNWGPTQQIV
jgi:hypothetical protein